MSEGIMARYAGTLMLLLFISAESFPQEAVTPPVRFMFYNVENLFDTYNDTLRDDEEFLPSGLRRWNSTRYNSKINSVSKTIIAAGEWQLPSLIGLCEIENRKVLEDLIYSTGLSRYDYGILHEDSGDPRGIDVALIYLKDRVVIDRYRYVLPEMYSGNRYSLRGILYAKCIITGDTVHVFINHWPSRRGGVLAGEGHRLELAEMLKRLSDSIAIRSAGRARIIIAGDFNSTPDDNAISLLTSGISPFSRLVNLSADMPAGSGTYRYRGSWEMIDQIIVSEYFLKCESGLFTGKEFIRIFKPGFLLSDDPVYPGSGPFSTYRGYSYQGGYSDHLPVLLDLMIRKKD